MRTVTLTVLALVVFATFSPAGTSQSAAPTLAQGQTSVTLYVAGPALGGVMSPDASTATTSIKKSLIASVINPGLGTTVILGTFTPAEDVTFTSDTAVNLYLVADTAAAYDQIQAQLVGSGLSGASAASPLTTPVAVQAAGAEFRIAIPTLGQTVKAGTKVTFQLILFGVAAAGTPADLFLLYGSVAHPSGLSFSTTAAAPFPTVGSVVAAFLSDKSLTPDSPTATTDKSASISQSTCTASCFGSVPGWTWGKMKSTSAFTVAGNSVVTVWVSPPGGAGAMRGFSSTLVLGTSSFAATQGTVARTWSSSAAVKFSFSFETLGAEVEEGADISVGFQAWTTSDAGAVNILYGSVARPSGAMIPIVGGVAVAGEGPLISLLAEKTALPGPANGSAPGAVTVANGGADVVTVTINATSDLPVAFEAEGPYSVAGNASTALNFTIDLAGTADGETYNVTLAAMVDGVEVANLTFTVTVEAPEPPATVEESPGTSDGGEESAAPREADEAGLPGFEASVLLAASLLGMLAWRRRRA